MKPELLVDIGRRDLARRNCTDGGSRAGHAVAAGKNGLHVVDLAGAFGHKRSPFDGDTGLLKARDLHALSDGDDDDVRRDAHFGKVCRVRAGSAGLVGKADDLRLHPEGGGLARFVCLDAHRRAKLADLRALGNCALHLVGKRGHVRNSAAIDAGDAGGSQTHGASRHVHRHVAAADDHDALAGEVRHDIVADGAQHLNGRHDIFAVLAGNAGFLVRMRADGDIQAVVVFMQLLEGNVFADGHFGMYFHAGGQNGGNLRVQLFAREAVSRDAVAEHTAELLLFLKNCHAVPHEAQIIRAGKAARAAADDGDALAGRLPAGRIRNIPCVVDCIALEAPDIDGRVDHIAAAARFTRMLADIRTGGRHGVILANQAHGVCVPPLAHQRDIARHIHARRTERNAGHGVLQRREAPVVLNVVHVIVPEALKAAQDQLRRVAADGAVGRGDDGAPFFRWCRWSASYQYRRAPAPSICSAGQVQCGRARICRTTARGTAAKMSATYRSDTGPEDWTRSCVPCPCRGGQRPSGPCLRF